MDLVTVYKAFTKKAAGMPASPEGGVFKPKPLPPPITTPGSQPLPTSDNPAPAPEQPPMTPEESQSKGMQMLEKGWEKTMDTMKAMTAMNNGMAPQDAGLTQPATGGQPQSTPDIPPMPPAPMPGPGAMKLASANYGTIYNSMFGLSQQKKANETETTTNIELDPAAVADAAKTGLTSGLIGGIGVGGAAGYGVGRATYDLLGMIPAMKNHKGWRLLLGTLTGIPSALVAGGLAAPTAAIAGVASKVPAVVDSAKTTTATT